MSKLPTPERETYQVRARFLWSFLVRSAKVCCRCHYTSVHIEQFDADHILRRGRSKALAVDLENGACECTSCHRQFRHDTSPAGVKKAENWLQEKFASRLPVLEERARTLAVSFSWRSEYERLYAELSRRGLLEEFRAYLSRHPSQAKIWTEGKELT